MSKISVLKFLIPRRYRSSVRDGVRYLRCIPYLGTRFECPLCGGRFDRFLPSGLELRPNAQCPRCGSLERHRLVELYLQNETDFYNSESKILHIAPEQCFRRKWQHKENFDYMTADLSNPLVDINIDITSIPVVDNTFDFIMCSHVLEHIPDDRKAIAELFRILKPGGWAILVVPIDINRRISLEVPNIRKPEEREKLFGQSNHVRIYGLDYVVRLEEAGFSVSIIPYSSGLGIESVRRYGLFEDENIYHCSKRVPQLQRV